MEVEITPQPTEEEHAAIAAAMAARLALKDGSAWWLAGLPGVPDEENGDGPGP